MSLYLRDGFDAGLAALPGVTFVDQWEAHIAKVGGKVFCLLSDAAPHRLVFKCGEDSFDILTSLDGVAQAAYFAKRKWVSVEAGSELREADLLAYITRSHGLVAAGLTKKLRVELGIL
ncbi:MmcQ/YjbR family DNA-binding protein [Devosia sp. XJ19-1]|uniref:MmcQ/YjbR family DNA-binding protein n=1 Tax=Devosia ureilytica TaxID=2952754 RepID=A0A9Q4ASK9_9HYPH|nr:MmcQ/YjbR family DNA-binding protein [Devosia ureilytica]MCP8885353.1 MmcQ/YjbR family DNA-binding protein [Devosia ureilytica]MCP8888971.1 MmcQ/YjbR family DNA-binding protein [Devosia ureilytica]